MSLQVRLSTGTYPHSAHWRTPTGLLREFFSKEKDFSRVANEEVQHAVELINDRPRKVLGYKTANEVYREMLHSA